MKITGRCACFVAAIAGLLLAGQAAAVTVEFTAGEGYADGDLLNHPLWNALPDADGPNTDNIIDVNGIGHDGALGLVGFSINAWSESIYSNAFTLSAHGDALVLSSKFQYDTVGTPLGQAALYSLQHFDTYQDTAPAVRVGLRRFVGVGGITLRFFAGLPGGSGGGNGQDSLVEMNLVATPDTSPWLLMTTSLKRGETSNDWALTATLTNLSDNTELLSSEWTVMPSAAFIDDPDVFGGLNGSREDAYSATANRVIDTFTGEHVFTDPQLTIIGGATGDGDFEFPETPGSPGTVTGALWYDQHPNWFNASGSEGINFSQDTDTLGSSQPGSRAGMPFQSRKQVNNTGFTVTAAGQTLNLRYEFGRVGVGYDDDESMRTFLFTADAQVIGTLETSNMTEFASVVYTYPTTEFWTTFTTNAFYTTTEPDIGKTFYFGLEHNNPGGVDVFPRIDVIRLTAGGAAPPPVTTLIGGSTGNGDFEATEPTTGAEWYSVTPNWFNASGSEGINFTQDSQTAGSSQPNSRAGMPFQARKQVNDSGYTVAAAGEIFNLSYDFGRVGVGYDNDESMRSFLFTADVPVNGLLEAINMTEFASVVYTYPTTGFWTTFTTNAFYTTTESDVGKTLYFGMEHNNPSGVDVFPRIDVIELTVAGAPPPPGCEAYIVCDDFDYSLPWPAWWNLGDGFFLNTNAQTAVLSTFGSGWGSKGDGTGVAGLDSTVGYASFTVTDNGVDPIGGNFIVTHDVNFNTADALVNVQLAVGGAGTYEVLWNNSGVSKSFTMPLSGWSGTIGGDSTVWIVNGVTTNAHWSPATSASNVDPLEAANRFGFWVNVAGEVSIIDDVRIADTLTPGLVVEPTLTISQSGSNVVVDWTESGFRLQNLTDELSTTNWLDYPLPGGTNPPVTVSVPVDVEFFRLIEQ